MIRRNKIYVGEIFIKMVNGKRPEHYTDDVMYKVTHAHADGTITLKSFKEASTKCNTSGEYKIHYNYANGSVSSLEFGGFFEILDRELIMGCLVFENDETKANGRKYKEVVADISQDNLKFYLVEPKTTPILGNRDVAKARSVEFFKENYAVAVRKNRGCYIL